MEKVTIRNEVKQKIASMSDEQYNTLSHMICHRALQEYVIQEGKIIAVTISNKPEVHTITLIEALWQQGKCVAVPKCDVKARTMDFYVIRDFSQLETVYMHLKEPIPAMTEYVSKQKIDVVVVPGVAFDDGGYRVGYGGGYYDRFLVDYQGELVTLAFDEQLYEVVPKEIHDVPVHRIITQSRVIDCLKNRKGQQ